MEITMVPVITMTKAEYDEQIRQAEQNAVKNTLKNLFDDLEDFRGKGMYSEVYCLLDTSVAKLKKKYGVSDL